MNAKHVQQILFDLKQVFRQTLSHRICASVMYTVPWCTLCLLFDAKQLIFKICYIHMYIYICEQHRMTLEDRFVPTYFPFSVQFEACGFQLCSTLYLMRFWIFVIYGMRYPHEGREKKPALNSGFSHEIC